VRLRLGQGLQLGQLGAIDALEQEPREFAAGCKYILAILLSALRAAANLRCRLHLPASG
jgi:hypothetical protein